MSGLKNIIGQIQGIGAIARAHEGKAVFWHRAVVYWLAALSVRFLAKARTDHGFLR